MLLLITATLLKIGFVIAVLLGIAPVLTWAERRQSAMMQDRVGCVRGGIPLPGYLALSAIGLGTLFGAYALNALVSFFVSEGASFVWSLVPLGGFVQFYMDPATAWPAAVLGAVQTGGLALFLFAQTTKISVADFLRGPAPMGARLVALGSGGFAALALIGGLYFIARDAMMSPADASAALTAGEPELATRLGMYFGMAFFGAVISVTHVGLAWFVENSVDKKNELTLFGLLHPAWDAVKMIWKEDFAPPNADKLLHGLAPIIALIPAFATFAVIPFGADLLWGPEEEPFKYLFSVVPTGAAVGDARVIPLQVASINVGMLYIFAIAGMGIVGAAIAGYSSDNKYALLGGLRAASQMVSYEVTLGLTLVGCFMIYNTLLLDEMVAWQVENVWGFVVQPVGLLLFFWAAIAEMKRIPFDAPEGESEIVAGYFLEYSGLKFAMFMTGEFVEHIVSSAIIVTLFFGGYHVPLLHADGFHTGDFIGYDIALPHIAVIGIGVVAFLLKVGVFIFLQIQVRWTLPRFRYDQIMQLCWKIILPLCLANILVTGVVILLLGA
ncbi:MAG: NADH-quinone oxidoreductase subunit H [Sandaracinaceae bacterium]